MTDEPWMTLTCKFCLPDLMERELSPEVQLGLAEIRAMGVKAVVHRHAGLVFPRWSIYLIVPNKGAGEEVATAPHMSFADALKEAQTRIGWYRG